MTDAVKSHGDAASAVESFGTAWAALLRWKVDDAVTVCGDARWFGGIACTGVSCGPWFASRRCAEAALFMVRVTALSWQTAPGLPPRRPGVVEVRRGPG